MKRRQSYREVEFGKDTLEKPNRIWQATERDGFAPQKPKKRGPMQKMKKVRLIFRPDNAKTDKRKGLSASSVRHDEAALDAGCLLLQGKKKATGEIALAALEYTIRRALNILVGGD